MHYNGKLSRELVVFSLVIRGQRVISDLLTPLHPICKSLQSEV